MPLASDLDTTKGAVRAALPPTAFDAIARSIDDLHATGIAGRAVGLGDLVALPILASVEGSPIDLAEVAAGRPVVLVFYRGGWCPYCNTTLRAYAEALPAIAAAGGVLVAVTPETPGHALDTGRDAAPGVTVAVDAGNRFAKTLGLVFALPEGLRPVYRDLGIDLPARNGDDSHELPIPATYVLAASGRVAWAHVDADFTRRADPGDAVAALEKLGAERDRHARAA